MISWKRSAIMLLLLLFVLVKDSLFVFGELNCIEKEREALLRFKQDLIDDGDILSSWGSEDDKKECCQWKGIKCSNDTGRVIALQLICEGLCDIPLRGKISSALLELIYLNRLDLIGHDFGNDEIPEFIGSFDKLQHLNLMGSNFSGVAPHQLGNLTNLRTLELGGNSLTFDNLNWLSNLSSLSLLDLGAAYLRDVNFLQYIVKLPSLTGLYLVDTRYIPTYLFVISSSTSLSELDLSWSGLDSSSFRWLFNITTNLRSIYLSGNNLKFIPDDFGRFTLLKNLDLSESGLTGGIPKFSGNLSHLKVLDLSGNQITGSVPDLRSLVSLKELHLRGNKLKHVPTTVGQLSKLEVFDVSFNSIEGTIVDAHLSKLHNLKVLELSFNSLFLNFIAEWVPPFQLHVIRLASCNMGPHFPAWIRTQTNFSVLDVSFAGIADEMPGWFWDLSTSITNLNLSHNQISGSILDLSSNFAQASYLSIDISYNNFSGNAPLFHQDFWMVQLSYNKFVGPIPLICTITSGWLQLEVLDLSNNQFSGEIPNCWENTPLLSVLNLSNNKLSGNIPPSLGSVNGLYLLQLRENNLSGELPSNLKNCNNLKMIDVGGNELTGNIPSWIGTNLSTFLNILSLGHNKFHGNIPPQICYLTKIQILDLSRNFISGKIPQCIKNFTSLVEKDISFDSTLFSVGYNPTHDVDVFIDRALVQWMGKEAEYRKTTLGLLKLIELSSNRLVGNIPHEFSRLRALISLNVSGNYLSGNIISNIGQMEMLESLDLSRNQLSGEIPAGLAELHYLEVLDSSNNKLCGKIPSGTQLQSFDPSAYAGNRELCGLPLPSCPGYDPNPSTTDGKGENIADDFEAQFLSQEWYISIILGFIVGFWGAVATLVFKSSWRNAYFNLFERISVWLYVTTTIYAGRIRRSLRTNAHT